MERWLSFIGHVYQGVGGAMLLLLDEEASAEVIINISLTRQLPNVISVIKPELGFHFHI